MKAIDSKKQKEDSNKDIESTKNDLAESKKKMAYEIIKTINEEIDLLKDDERLSQKARAEIAINFLRLIYEKHTCSKKTKTRWFTDVLRDSTYIKHKEVIQDLFNKFTDNEYLFVQLIKTIETKRIKDENFSDILEFALSKNLTSLNDLDKNIEKRVLKSEDFYHVFDIRNEQQAILAAFYHLLLLLNDLVSIEMIDVILKKEDCTYEEEETCIFEYHNYIEQVEKSLIIFHRFLLSYFPLFFKDKGFAAHAGRIGGYSTNIDLNKYVDKAIQLIKDNTPEGGYASKQEVVEIISKDFKQYYIDNEKDAEKLFLYQNIEDLIPKWINKDSSLNSLFKSK